MKKMIFVVIIFVSFALFADETNWISYDGWVTGPGSGDNKNTYLLPFGYYQESYGFVVSYYDERPLLYETDMGWPVPDKEENNLKYLFFGDTYFFMRDPTPSHKIMSKISNGSETLLDFEVENNAAEIEKQHYFSPFGGNYLATISHDICKQNCTQEHGSCNDEKCAKNCLSETVNKNKYSECFSYCNASDAIEGEYNDIFNYMNFNQNNKEERCENFCMFDMVSTYASLEYFSSDGQNIPENNGKKYNNGTSNIFLAAELDTDGTGNETQYKVKFRTNTGETGGTGEQDEYSAQLYSTKEENIRRSKSIWKNSYEKGFDGFIGIYPRGYFYACPGAPEDSRDTCSQESKKLFVPYNVNGWDFLNEDKYCNNAVSHPILSDNLIFLPVSERMKLKFDYLNSAIGIGIYDFENECRVKFSNDQQLENPFSQPRTCSTTEIDNGCYQDYPNRHILWPNLSKMSNVTVIHGLNHDILSPDDGKEYIYFMGTGEAEVDVDKLISFDCGNSNDVSDDNDDNENDDDNDVDYYEICNDDDAEENDEEEDDDNGNDEDHDLIHKTQKAYIARVRAYESEIKCAASYEYFAGITNGIARWEKDMSKAEPLYGFYPLQAMGAESIVKHRDLYWMTAPLNETMIATHMKTKKDLLF